ncbi:AAA family ATPase, partial [Streptomyces sp. NPDC088357]|uniref:nSTAND1 domain-containing NTPase n=1 Tax=Streptomyces sp. NPDC088357 TaxID=3154655 RepID=UPI00341643EA
MPGPDFSQAVARVWGAGSEPVGSAFLVGPRTLLTCAHVLAHARSGRSRRAQRHPVVPQEGWEVEVDFPQHDTARRHGAQRLTARAVMVAPADGLHGDICVLELLDEEPQLLGRLVLHPLDDLQGRGFRTFGYPADFEDGVSARGRLRGIVGGSWLEAVTDEIEPGFSGAPVWANPLSGVVGMVVARHGSGRAYAVPVRSLFAAHPPLREMALPPSPYRGLEPFEQDDALVFAGRDAMAGELADLVGKHPVTVVHGPSGVGKTSLVRAGVLPRLAASGAATAAVRLHPQIALAAELAAALRIGGEPAPAAVCEELARLLGPPAPAALSAWLESAGADRLVVVLDQLDEVLAADPAAATAIDAYVGRLTRTSDGVPTPVRVLVTARDTFRHLAGEHTPTIYTAWDARGRAVNPPTSAELREMITKPLRTVRCTIASALVEQIVEDTRSSTSALPLVEETLSALYQRQQSGRLTGTAYQDIGGVTGALQQRADDVVDRLRSLEHAPESLLTQLVRPDDTTGERAQGQPPQDVRRVALREDLSDEQWQVAQELATARLVVTTSGVGPSGPGTAELAHQVLIDAWPQLRKWIAASRDFRVWQESLRDALHRWRAAEPGRDRRHALLRATELRLASRWLRQRGDDVRPHERDFIELSRRRRNILRGWLAALVAFIATAVGIVVQQSNSASAHQHALGLSRQLAAHSSGASPAVARQLAVSAWAVAQTDEAGAAVAGLLREARQNSVMVVSTSAVRSLAFTHDGRYLATGADDGTLRRWDARTGGPVGKPVTASQADGRSTRVNAVAFDPDGKVLVTGTGDGRLRGWNPRTGRPAAEPVAFGPVEVTSVAISANGKVMAVGTGGGTLDVWRIPSGDPVRGTTLVGGIVRAVALSPDGKTVATASGDGQLEVWDVESGDRRYAVVASSPASDSSVDVSAVTFSDDGSVLASGGHDGTLRLWNPTTGRPLRKPIPVGSSVNAVAFSPDGKTLATGTDDGTARLWNPTTGRPLRKPIPVRS